MAGGTTRDYVLGYLIEHGPATVPQIAEAADADTFGVARAERFRTMLMRLELEGEVMRTKRVSATGARGEPRGGPRPWVWSLPCDSDS